MHDYLSKAKGSNFHYFVLSIGTVRTWPEYTTPPAEEEPAEAGGARRAMQLRLQSVLSRAGGGEDNRLIEEDLPTPHDVAGGLYPLER
jgi:hypothetical protein